MHWLGEIKSILTKRDEPGDINAHWGHRYLLLVTHTHHPRTKKKKKKCSDSPSFPLILYCFSSCRVSPFPLPFRPFLPPSLPLSLSVSFILISYMSFMAVCVPLFSPAVSIETSCSHLFQATSSGSARLDFLFFPRSLDLSTRLGK